MILKGGTFTIHYIMVGNYVCEKKGVIISRLEYECKIEDNDKYYFFNKNNTEVYVPLMISFYDTLIP